MTVTFANGAAAKTARATREKDLNLRTIGPLSYTKICPKPGAEMFIPPEKAREFVSVRRQFDGRALMLENS